MFSARALVRSARVVQSTAAKQPQRREFVSDAIQNIRLKILERQFNGAPATGPQTTRVLSPHVTVYNFPPAAISSITHRTMGVLMTFGVWGIGVGAAISGDVPGYIDSLGDMGSGCKTLMKFSLAAPFVFHYFAGLRHLMWDNLPYRMNKRVAVSSNKVMLAVAGVGILAATAVSFEPKQKKEE